MSFDVVPAFAKSNLHEIPDTGTTKGWTETNPKIHAEKATEANEKFGGEWKGMVRMAKSWNRTNNKVVNPVVLDRGDGTSGFAPALCVATSRMSLCRSSRQWADRIDDTWPDPAGLGAAG